jgi:hypothetical protein
MKVDVIAWDRQSAVAVVDGIRVRIRRSQQGARWICDLHGTDEAPHCPHLQALADTPPPPEKELHP